MSYRLLLLMKVGTDEKSKSKMNIREFVEYIICVLIFSNGEKYALQSSGSSSLTLILL